MSDGLFSRAWGTSLGLDRACLGKRVKQGRGPRLELPQDQQAWQALLLRPALHEPAALGPA